MTEGQSEISIPNDPDKATQQLFTGDNADKLRAQAEYLAENVGKIAKPIELQDHFSVVSEVLSQLKRLKGEIEEERASQNRPLNDEISARNAEARVLLVAVEAGIAMLSPHVLIWMKDHEDGDRSGAQGSKSSVRGTWKYEVRNWRDIPAEYLETNKKRVTARIRGMTDKEKEAGGTIKGIHVYKEESVASRRK